MYDVLKLMRKYKIPPPLKKEVLVNKDLLEEAAEYLDNFCVFQAFPGFIFLHGKGMALEIDERLLEAVKKEYGVDGKVWDGRFGCYGLYLEVNVDMAKDVFERALVSFPERLVVVGRETLLIRIEAEPGWREYSPVSVVSQLFYRVDDIFALDNRDVYPPRSGIGIAFLKKERNYDRGELFLSFLRRVFSQRNKKVLGERPERLSPEELLQRFETTA